MLGVFVFASGCAAKRITLPTDPGAALPDFAQIHSQLTSSCSGQRTLTAELGLSGRAGEQRLRGRVVAGFERPGSMRLEGVAPFGPPAFILAARGETAVLLLPRDSRVVRGAGADAILGALTGLTLTPSDLHAIVSGCVAAAAKPEAGRLHGNGWASVDLANGGRVYLQRVANQWVLRAATRDRWTIEYPAWSGAFPAAVRVRSDAAGTEVDVTATVTQLEANVDIDPAAFTVDVPADARPLSVEELRDAGPLRGQ